MQWIERLNHAIDYIEEHLTEEIDYAQLGKITCCSSYHFQRMFTYMAEVSLSEYIRRRRMSLAAVDIQNRNLKIIDVALKYGYSSPTAFNRAFQSVHGIAPSAVRKQGVSLRSYPPIKFTITVKGVEEMNYRIESKNAFRIVGVSVPLSRELEKNFEVIPSKWQEITENGVLNQLIGMMNSSPMGVLGVCSYNQDEPLKYYISVATDQPQKDFEEYIVPAATWAIFSGSGPNQSIQELERRILTEWLPTSGYEYGNGADVEVYINPDPENAQYEIWIPVVQKQN